LRAIWFPSRTTSAMVSLPMLEERRARQRLLRAIVLEIELCHECPLPPNLN